MDTFYIATEVCNQYKLYGTYLNNMVEIGEMIRYEIPNVQESEDLTISFCNFENSSLTLSNISMNRSTRDKSINDKTRKVKKGRVLGLSRVKKATRCIAKKLNRVFVGAKTKLLKPLKRQKADIPSSSRTSNGLEPMQTENEYQISNTIEIHSDEAFSRGVISMENWNGQSLHQISSMNLFNSMQTSPDSSFSSETSDSMSIIQQRIAESMADFNEICAQSERNPSETNIAPKIQRQGTPYKIRMSKYLTVYDDDSVSF